MIHLPILTVLELVDDELLEDLGEQLPADVDQEPDE
jgi:hypothetical protein